MHKLLIAITIVVIGTALAGCTSGYSYQRVDLRRNLDQATLDRYESEWQALQPDGQTGHMVQLERSNWWPLGIIAYHRDASVMRTDGPSGPIYHVTSGQGFGPLSLLYSVSTHATYTAKGERINWMRMHGVIKGCLGMGHETAATLADGREERASSWHWVKHIFNYHTMDGHTYVSLFTVPNPIGLTLGSHH